MAQQYVIVELVICKCVILLHEVEVMCIKCRCVLGVAVACLSSKSEATELGIKPSVLRLFRVKDRLGLGMQDRHA